MRVIPLVGSIMARSGGGRNLNLAGVQKQVEDAFDCKKVQPKAVVLNINSPGGSAVQSNLIYSRIRNLADKTKIPVISFIEDTCASGGYWLALAGDEIYADPNSVVGSIGAISILFGVEETLKKLGNIKCHYPEFAFRPVAHRTANATPGLKDVRVFAIPRIFLHIFIVASSL